MFNFTEFYQANPHLGDATLLPRLHPNGRPVIPPNREESAIFEQIFIDRPMISDESENDKSGNDDAAKATSQKTMNLVDEVGLWHDNIDNDDVKDGLSTANGKPNYPSRKDDTELVCASEQRHAGWKKNQRKDSGCETPEDNSDFGINSADIALTPRESVDPNLEDPDSRLDTEVSNVTGANWKRSLQ